MEKYIPCKHWSGPRRTERHHQATALGWRLWNSNKSRTHDLSKYKWNVLKIGYYLGHKTNPNKFKRIEIIQSVLPDHYRFKLKINNRIITEKFTNSQELKNILLNNPWVKEEDWGKLENILNLMEIKIQNINIWIMQLK